MKIHRYALVVVGLLTGLLGCSGTDQAAQSGEPDVDVKPIGDMRAFTLPLDAYVPTRDQEATLLNAENRLKAECLARFGFNIAPPTVTPVPLTRNERRYGVSDPKAASTYGYGVPAIENRVKQEDPELSDAAIAVMTGRGQDIYDGKPVPEGGCDGEAKRKVAEGPSSNADSDLAQTLAIGTFHKSREDSRVVAAATSWRECMKRAGYFYTSPLDANDDPAFAKDPVSTAEISTATADVRCKTEANLVNIWAAVETAYQLRAIEENLAKLEQAKALLETRLRNAAKVMGQ